MANSISQIPANPVAFASARPVWPKGRELEKNLLVGFRAVFRAPAAAALRLRLAAATLYRVFVNGRFLAHGPARAAHEFYRVDEWNLTGHVGNGDNVLAIEVAGYNINSYCYLNQPSFLQAEILADGDVLAATGNPGADFVAFIVPDRVQRVQRYSFQRAFIEVYRKDEQSDAWRRRPDAPVTPGECAIQREKKLLPRGVPYPDFRTRPALWSVAEGQVRRRESVEKCGRIEPSPTSVQPSPDTLCPNSNSSYPTRFSFWKMTCAPSINPSQATRRFSSNPISFSSLIWGPISLGSSA